MMTRKRGEKNKGHEAQVVQISPEGRGFPKIGGRSVNVQRDVTEGERQQVPVKEPRQERVIVSVHPPVSQRSKAVDVPGAFS